MGIRAVNKDGLNVNEQKFVAEYIRSLDATLAMKAGQFKTTQSPKETLRRPQVRAAIQRELDEQIAEFRLQGMGILRTLLHRATYDPREFVHADGTPKGVHELDDACALASEVRFTDQVVWDPETKSHVVRQLTQIRTASKEQAIDKLLRVLQLMDNGPAILDQQKPAPERVLLTGPEAAL